MINFVAIIKGNTPLKIPAVRNKIELLSYVL